jgi:hypothetical protein
VDFIGSDEVVGLTADGYLTVALDEDGGLQTTSAELGIKLNATNPGLVLSSDGIAALTQGVIDIDASGIKLVFGTGLQNDAGTLKTKDTEIDHDNLLNFATNEHVDHTAVNINTTAPLQGGGDISATRTLSIDSATTAAEGVVKQATARADSGETAVTLTAVTTTVTDPADAPADADALRDDLVANALSEIETALGNLSTRDGELETSVETLATEFNDLLAKLRTAGVLNT